MPQLTAQQMRQLEAALKASYQRLVNEVQDEMERSGNVQYAELLGRYPGDIADESVADAMADLNVQMVDRQIREMRDIEAARQRIKAGEYGLCTDCRADIGFERLLAYPTAKRCIVCQRQHERTFAGEGHPTL